MESSKKRLPRGLRSPFGRKPKNDAEGKFWQEAAEMGWIVSKRGWPDFACWDGETFIAVEVKPKAHHRLKKMQVRIMRALVQAGVPCYRWTPQSGLVHISESGV